MASFSFGAGNARKLLSIPLYALGRLATLIIPRTSSTWVFGCAVGVADGALALHSVAAGRGERCTWIVANETQARDAGRLGIRAVRAGTVASFWATARAAVVVVTHGFGDVDRYAVDGAIIVQLWHGIPLKRIGLDSPETVRSALLPDSGLVRRLLAAMYARGMRRISVLPAASHLVRGRLESAFALTDAQVPVTGEPRVDVLSAGSASERRDRARALLESAVGALPPSATVVLYAPTWRDGAPDAGIPNPAEWQRIVAMLNARDIVLLVRSHPLGEGRYEPDEATDRVRSIPSRLVPDITPALSGLDVLVTDYSSLAFDAGLVPLPVLYFAPDLSSYVSRRGMYGRYADVAGSNPAATWEDLLMLLDAHLIDPEPARAQSRALSERVHAFADGGNSARVYSAIRTRLNRRKGVS